MSIGKKKNILIIIGLILTSVIFCEIFGLFTIDFATAIFPGWHTTIYPSAWLMIGGAIILVLIAIYKLTKYILLYVWKISSGKKQAISRNTKE